METFVFTVAGFSGFSFWSFSGGYGCAAVFSVGVVVRA
jgi:hypothetical protein